MFRYLTATLTLLVWTGLALGQTDPIFSGPQPGEKLTAFKVLAFSGRMPGKQMELIADAKETPRVLVFVHEITRPALQLLRPIDQIATEYAPDGLETHFVWLTADKTKTEQFLQGANKSLNLTSPIVISLDGIEGPGNYGLNRKVALTILVAKGTKVVANFAIVQPNETDAPKVTEAITKMMGKPATKAAPAAGGEAMTLLQKQVTELQFKVQLMTKHNADLELLLEQMTDALNQARAQIAKLEGKPAPEPLPKLPKLDPKPAGKAAKSPELQGLMRQMIQQTNDDATVTKLAGAMLLWAGKDEAKQTELREYCRLILQLGYGTPYCQKMLAKIAGK
ncbi:MAG TPA: hypothetical protein VE988_17690 [Gemmataceae bacterium]|nr:hypothetical protein [Gemmataceae bacterium]